MKRSVQYGILSLEALGCVGLVAMSAGFSGSFSGLLAFPFEQIGLALRALSLSGALGNALAIVCYAALSLSPVVVLLRRKKRQPEDFLLLLLSLALFFVLYQMINPGEISLVGGFAEGRAVAKAILGGTVDSVLIGYLVLRALRRFYASDAAEVQRYLSGLLFVLNLLFVALIFGSGVQELVQSVRAMWTENSGNEALYGINYLFIALDFVVDSLPYACNLAIVFAAMSLLGQLAQDRYGEATLHAADALSRLCGKALALVVASRIALNVLQLLCGAWLFQVNSSIEIPLFSILFVLGCLLLSGLVRENKALKEDSDSII